MNSTKRDLTFLVMILGSIFLGLGVSRMAYNAQQKRDATQQAQRDQLFKEFLGDIEKAKKETGDKCSQVFVSYIRPPDGINVVAPLIIMGEEIYLSSDEPSKRIWRIDYQLIPKGEKVELWKTQRLGVAMPPNNQDIRRHKIAEKYSPDSSQCRAK